MLWKRSLRTWRLRWIQRLRGYGMRPQPPFWHGVRLEGVCERLRRMERMRLLWGLRRVWALWVRVSMSWRTYGSTQLVCTGFRSPKVWSSSKRNSHHTQSFSSLFFLYVFASLTLGELRRNTTLRKLRTLCAHSVHTTYNINCRRFLYFFHKPSTGLATNAAGILRPQKVKTPHQPPSDHRPLCLAGL